MLRQRRRRCLPWLYSPHRRRTLSVALLASALFLLICTSHLPAPLSPPVPPAPPCADLRSPAAPAAAFATSRVAAQSWVGMARQAANRSASMRRMDDAWDAMLARIARRQEHATAQVNNSVSITEWTDTTAGHHFPCDDEAALQRAHAALTLVYTWVNGSSLERALLKDPRLENRSSRPAQWRALRAMLRSGSAVGSRERESDELRHSLRSVEQNMAWHTGDIAIVSPGDVPTWLDLARNFFVPRRRIRAIHQDALMPAIVAPTRNTNTVEHFLYRIRGLSTIFVQFNDDYIVNGPTSVSDFINSAGGPVLLHEGGQVIPWRSPAVAHADAGPCGLCQRDPDASRDTTAEKHPFGHRRNAWAQSVLSTHHFALRALGTAGGFDVCGASLRCEGCEVAAAGAPVRHPPYYLKHAPFVLHQAVFRDFAMPRFFGPALLPRFVAHKGRHATDVISPQLHHTVYASAAATPLSLPPATRRIGAAAKASLIIFTDALASNDRLVKLAAEGQPTFVAFNDGFTNSEDVGAQLRWYMEQMLPQPSVFEQGASAWAAPFHRLMALPLTIVYARGPAAAHEEGACLLLRSLRRLGLPARTGPVHVALVQSSAAPRDHHAEVFADLVPAGSEFRDCEGRPYDTGRPASPTPHVRCGVAEMGPQTTFRDATDEEVNILRAPSQPAAEASDAGGIVIDASRCTADGHGVAVGELLHSADFTLRRGAHDRPLLLVLDVCSHAGPHSIFRRTAADLYHTFPLPHEEMDFEGTVLYPD